MCWQRGQKVVLSLLLLAMGGSSIAAEPRVMIEGAKLELIASEPDIVTPVGMTFDEQGRLFVIESHTHQRPEGYDGPTGDRILMLADSEGNGQLDKWTVFAEGFQQSMNLLATGPGKIYLVTRRSVDLLVDENNDGRMDRQESILRLETTENYPHNAMSGIAFDGEGGLFVGLGENFGVPYKLVGTDGSSHSDQGGVGTIFRCTADGKKLRRFCNGFWNPFSICVSPTGAVFTVDNDPDSSPPCRLIHAVESGDYGHRFEYSRAGIHPLQAWDGELPGTLPMLAGTGEAPCAVVPHRGFLWVTSWGDHRLERYRLKANGASFIAVQDIAVQGDSDFRPTGCAIAPDGSLYFSDWVDHSYPVHGKGRIWRLSFSDEADSTQLPAIGVNAQRDWKAQMNSADPFQRQQVVPKGPTPMSERAQFAHETDSELLVSLQHLRWTGVEYPDSAFRQLLRDDSIDADAKLYLVRWIADERIQSLRDDVEGLLSGEIPNEKYYLAVLSALEWLDGDRKLRRASLNDGLLVRELKNLSRSPQLQTLALRLVSPDNKYLTLDRLNEYLAAEYQPMRIEAVRTLALQTNPERFATLAKVARDDEQGELVRAEAIAGLAATDEFDELLTKLSEGKNAIVREEARRVLRLQGKLAVEEAEKPPADQLDQWNELLREPGNALAGRRLFFSARGARCGVCHQHGGRGGKIGPDLTRISESNTREQLIASILQPSREMAPHYQPWKLQTDAGKTMLALRLHKSGDGGTEVYADTQGNTFTLRGDEIEVREASTTSIMPSGLEKTVSVEQLRDLVEFLSPSD